MQRLKDNYLLVAQKYEQFRSHRSKGWCLTPSMGSSRSGVGQPFGLGASSPSDKHVGLLEDLAQGQKSPTLVMDRPSFARGSETRPEAPKMNRSALSSLSRSEISGSSSSSQQLYEGGSRHSSAEEQDYDAEQKGENSIIQEEDDEGLDPDDPYQINRLNEIPHEHLKELYTQVVDELLDIQLEFEEKLAEVEE